MEKNQFLALVAVLGIAAGMMMAYSTSGQSYSEKLEDQIRSQKDFNGTVECFPPGTIEVNLSEQVENSTELRSVCRVITNGNVQILPITYSK